MVGLAEHGHFHLFLRAEGMPRGVSPLLFPERGRRQCADPASGGAAEARRAATASRTSSRSPSMAQGEPMRLFTTNRWVTGETWYRAADVARMLDRFAPAGRAGPSRCSIAGSTALVRLYRARDRVAAGAARRSGRPNGAGCGRAAATCSRTRGSRSPRISTSISTRASPRSTRWSLRRASPEKLPRRPGLPNMAEGWGA